MFASSIFTSADFEYLWHYFSANGQNQVYSFTKKVENFLSLILPNVFPAFYSTFQNKMVMKPRESINMSTKINTILIFFKKKKYFFKFIIKIRHYKY